MAMAPSTSQREPNTSMARPARIMPSWTGMRSRRARVAGGAEISIGASSAALVAALSRRAMRMSSVV